MRAWRHRSGCRNTDRPAPWLRTIARREALRAATRATPDEGLEGHGPAADDHADRVAARVDVDRAVARLAVREREVIFRHYWRDMSCEQIAHELACPTGTVKIRLHRAREKLRAMLDGD